MANPVKPIPEGMRTVTPHLICAGASNAIDFYKEAFGAVEISRLPGPSGRLMRASIRFGDSGQLSDPFGHKWSVATHIRDVSPHEMAEAVQAMSQQP